MNKLQELSLMGMEELYMPEEFEINVMEEEELGCVGARVGNAFNSTNDLKVLNNKGAMKTGDIEK